MVSSQGWQPCCHLCIYQLCKDIWNVNKWRVNSAIGSNCTTSMLDHPCDSRSSFYTSIMTSQPFPLAKFFLIKCISNVYISQTGVTTFCWLLKDTISSWTVGIALSGRWIGKDVGGSSDSLIKILSWYLPRVTEENHRYLSIAIVQVEI
jgi:hypothetical protein